MRGSGRTVRRATQGSSQPIQSGARGGDGRIGHANQHFYRQQMDAKSYCLPLCFPCFCCDPLTLMTRPGRQTCRRLAVNQASLALHESSSLSLSLSLECLSHVAAERVSRRSQRHKLFSRDSSAENELQMGMKAVHRSLTGSGSSFYSVSFHFALHFV